MNLFLKNKSVTISKEEILNSLLILVVFVYIVASWLFHVEVTKLVVGKYKNITGSFIPREHSIEFSLIVLAIVIISLVYKIIKGKRRIYTLIYFAFYIIILVLFYMFLSLHQVEAIHLIQYMSIAYFLSYVFDRDRSKFLFSKILFWGIAFGIIDELLQYYVVAPGHRYLDFNDFFVNQLGIIIGLLLFYGFRDIPKIDRIKIKPFYKSTGFKILFVISILLSFLFITGNLKVSPRENIPAGSIVQVDGTIVIYMERIPGKFGSWQKHFVKGEYYTLTPLEGVLLILLVGILFATFDPYFIKSLKLLPNQKSNDE